MTEITLVTAFFDIGRSSFPIYARSNERYFEYFDFWARIQNDLIVYCAPEDAEKILRIRKKYQRDKKTTIIPILNIFGIEPELYQKMKALEYSREFRSFRYYENAVSNMADYDYLMMLKYWFMWDASINVIAKNPQVMWLDFGYNHGGEYYIRPEDFDFKWEYEFDRKINLFCLSDPEKMPAIDSLQFQKDCFIGHTVVCPKEMTFDLWRYIRDAMWALVSLDCIDDDQQLLLMFYKLHKEQCRIRICGWFHDMELCSTQRFQVKEPPEKRPAAGGYRRQNEEFVARCQKRAFRYYGS